MPPRHPSTSRGIARTASGVSFSLRPVAAIVIIFAMARIPPVAEDSASAEVRDMAAAHAAAGFAMSNMKWTLAHSPVALAAVLEFLTASGAMMVATNVLNRALRVDLDVHLLPYPSAT
jgi:hypothetical protein